MLIVLYPLEAKISMVSKDGFFYTFTMNIIWKLFYESVIMETNFYFSCYIQ